MSKSVEENTKGFEVAELEDSDLEEVAGGVAENGNCNGCNCPCEEEPEVQ